MKTTFTYRGYDGEDHTFTRQWWTEDPNLSVFMTGRSFEKAVQDREAVEPSGHHKITVERV